MGLQEKTLGEFETCCCGCGELTSVRKDAHVDSRNFYVEGVGQLRPECYLKIYGPSRTDETRTRLELSELGIPDK